MGDGHPGVDRMLGRAAVERGWVSEARLAEALAAQAREEAEGRPRRLLGALLFERGDLSETQVAELLDAQARAEITEEEAAFGALLVRNGLATWEAVSHALGVQLTMRVPKRLGEILRERGEVDAQALAAPTACSTATSSHATSSSSARATPGRRLRAVLRTGPGETPAVALELHVLPPRPEPARTRS